MYHLPVVALFASLAAATLLGRQTSDFCKKHPNSSDCVSEYMSDVCNPGATTADFNFDVPCNIGTYIGYECTFGQKIKIGKNGPEMPDSKPQDNSTQRLCACSSEYFQAMQGCIDCYQAHGGLQAVGLPSGIVTSLSSAYCAATATPTLGLFEYQELFGSNLQSSGSSGSNSASATVTFSDPIGNKTDASLYWTAPVTGTAILNIGEFTGTAKPTTTKLEEGQIVATAGSNAQNSGQTTDTANTAVHTTGMATADTSTGTTTTSGIAARQTEAVFAGVLGLVGIVAML